MYSTLHGKFLQTTLHIYTTSTFVAKALTCQWLTGQKHNIAMVSRCHSSALWVSDHTPSHLSTVKQHWETRNPHKETSGFYKKNMKKHGKITNPKDPPVLASEAFILYTYQLHPMDYSWRISWMIEVSCSPGIRYPWTMARNAACGVYTSFKPCLSVQTKGMNWQWRNGMANTTRVTQGSIGSMRHKHTDAIDVSKVDWNKDVMNYSSQII